MVYRVYVEKKQGSGQRSPGLCWTRLQSLSGHASGWRACGCSTATTWRSMARKTCSGYAVKTVFSEPQLDTVTACSSASPGAYVFAVEYLPGQFDQRADSAAQCIQIISQGERPIVRTAKVYALYGALTAGTCEAVKKYVINPVECREASLDVPETLRDPTTTSPQTVATLTGFTGLEPWRAWRTLMANCGLAMDLDDIAFCQAYFRDRKTATPPSRRSA